MKRPIAPAVAASLLAITAASCLPPEWGANAILHPRRRPVTATPDIPFEPITFSNRSVTLKGWLFRTPVVRRALLVYLHGIADNRQSAMGFAHRLVPRGCDVFAYDSRAHGDSTGDACTYGFYEKQDLARALDALGAQRAVLFGTSLGAAVALQAAASDRRVAGVVAIAPFADLPSIVSERAPWFATRREIEEALSIAGRRGRFSPEEVSPLRAASLVRVPVLLLHGERDSETAPSHSQRIYAALAGPKELILVPGAHHNDVPASEEVWRSIETWLLRLDSVFVAVRPPIGNDRSQARWRGPGAEPKRRYGWSCS
ncbi:MAG: alpha/beta hydrolase [Acidobacteriota bacterium]